MLERYGNCGFIRRGIEAEASIALVNPLLPTKDGFASSFRVAVRSRCVRIIAVAEPT